MWCTALCDGCKDRFICGVQPCAVAVRIGLYVVYSLVRWLQGSVYMWCTALCGGCKDRFICGVQHCAVAVRIGLYVVYSLVRWL